MDAGQPLASHVKVATQDVSRAAEQVGRIFCAHRLSPLDRGAAFFATHNSLRFAGGSINYVAYGGDVEIDPGCLERFYLIQVPMRGGAEIRCGTAASDTLPARAASVLSPTRPSVMRWHRSCGQLILMLERSHLESMMATFLDTPVEEIVFEPLLRLDQDPGRIIAAQIGHLARMAESPAAHHPALLQQVADSICSALIWGHGSNVRAGLFDLPTGGSATPSRVSRALAFIDAHLDGTIDYADLARHCGCSLRALQIAFKTHRSQTLTEAVQERRLALLRERLTAGGQGQSITDLIHAAGFTHLGRAASAYRERYGERPSDTLRRSAG